MKEAIKIVEYEIRWHEENKSESPTINHAEVFIKGLKHILDVLKEAEASQQDDEVDKEQLAKKSSKADRNWFNGLG